MTRTKISLTRRQLLASIAAGAVLEPFVPLLETREAKAATTKRLVFFYSSNGTVREKWLPTMQNGQLVLSEILQPLEAFRSDLLVVDGLGYNVPGWTGHHLAIPLTGAAPLKLDQKENWLSTSVSVDQHVANTIGATTKFRSVECGIQVEDFSAWVSALSYRGSGQPLRPESSPYKIFDRLFTGLVPPAPDNTAARALEQTRLDRKSVIDFVTADLNGLRGKLGADEKKKLDAHLEAIRDIERSLTGGKGGAATDTCKLLDKGALLDIQKNDNIPLLGKLQTDILVMALACDLLRVGTIQHGRGGAQHRFTWLGPEFLVQPDNGPNDSTSGIHGLAHNETNPVSRAKLTRCHRWYAEQVAYLVGRLKAIPEGNGTMADSTLVVWMNEQGTGNHALRNTPWVLVGNAGGFLKPGRLLQFPGQPHNRLLINICQAMGLPTTTFGEPDFGKEALPGLS